jgi:hypothetical protein
MKEKMTTLRNVGNNSKQATVPKFVLEKYPKAKGINWIVKGKKITVEVVE